MQMNPIIRRLILFALAAVLLSCMPVGISVYVFSRRYESCETAVAAAIVITALATPLTLSLVAALILR